MPPHRALTVGRLFGVRIRLAYSVFVLLVVLTVSLKLGVFGVWHPDWPELALWGLALLGTALFVGSILAHELSHAIAAKAYDIPVGSITLFLLGGVASIEREPATAKQELVIAAAGPAMSLLLGGVFSLGGWLLVTNAPPSGDAWQTMQTMGPAATLLGWLGPVNVLIALFNLLPAYPLDGGRMLRAVLWKVTGNGTRATRWASSAGRGFGIALIGAGLTMSLGIALPVFGSGAVGGIWFVLVGWFLHRSATSAASDLWLREELDQVPIARLMQPTRQAVSSWQPIADIRWNAHPTASHGICVVLDDGNSVGVIRPADLQRLPEAFHAGAVCQQIMTPLSHLMHVPLRSSAFDLLQLFQRAKSNDIAVLAGGQIVGLVRTQDLARLVAELQEQRAAKQTLRRPALRQSSGGLSPSA